jgi:hypothetical protein
MDPSIASAVFFPRPDLPFSPPSKTGVDAMIDVGGAHVRLRTHLGPKDAPTLLFFHGNGETARDYDDVVSRFLTLPVTFAAADYRGYGPSTGEPSVGTFLSDAHRTLDFFLRLCAQEGRSGPVLVMGRSLGSAPAIELSSERTEVDGLVIESGFARFVPLLELLGVPARGMGLRESDGPGNLEKMARVTVPTLILHARGDQIIPHKDGVALHEQCAATQKRLVTIENAGHNDIMSVAGQLYFDALAQLLELLRPTPPNTP